VKKPTGKGNRKETASAEDDDIGIWRHTAATIEPLKRGKPRVHPAAERVKSDAPKAKSNSKTESQPATTGDSAHAAMRERAPSKSATLPRQADPPGLSAFDRNSARKIRIGRIEIEARVDLHGMRQDEAHAALKAFLFRSQNRGLRYVLVITGKGKPTGTSEFQSAYDAKERGILRRNVPRWLEEPDIRGIVVSYATAAIQHGGEGAIYVHLRARHRT
jgi:DNA-nicking Smr family endonuclease